MLSDDICSQEDRNLLDVHSEDTAIGSHTILYRSTSFESTVNRILLNNLNQLDSAKPSNQYKCQLPLESQVNKNSTSTPIKRAKTTTRMKPLTSEMVKNNFHVVDIEYDDETIELLTTTQGNNIYTTVLKEIMKAKDISKINFEDSFNDRGKYRYICSNVETCDWLVTIIPIKYNMSMKQVTSLP